ncbi:MCE family protein [Nocardia alni]|uniref:MCE family protein n=1 Tax=Nocardia alni TaxID=2815723 RepID=UPI001C24DCE4|nr:MlaD family protein [Nocardia alni]
MRWGHRRPRPLPRKLWVFAVIAVVSMVVAATEYAQLPQRAGIGRYTVSVRLHDGGGLYSNADVSYRGVTIGKVTALVTTESGARATLSLKSSAKVPADLDAAVRSMSAVGEQYIDLVPRRAGGPYLSDGAVISADRTSTPADIGRILDRIEASLQSIGPGNLRTALDESFTAVNGLGPQLRELVEALHQLAHAAAQVGGPASTLIDQLGPLLDTQTVTGDAIRQWASSLASLTGQLRSSDSDLRGVIGQAGPAADQVTALFDRVRPTLPLLLTNLVTVEQVAAVYNPSLEQILVLYPPLIAATQSAGLPNVDDPGQNTFFANELNDPPPCIQGFLPPDQRRSPTATDVPATPPNLYCKVASNDPRAVRGARNLPCMEYPGRRAATVQLCRDPSGNSQEPDQPATPPNPPVGTASYTPTDGSYVGGDGKLYADAGLRRGAQGRPLPLATLLAPPP